MGLDGLDWLPVWCVLLMEPSLMEFLLEFLLDWTELVLPCWCLILVEPCSSIIHLMEFLLEFLLDQSICFFPSGASFWLIHPFVLLHEGTLVNTYFRDGLYGV